MIRILTLVAALAAAMPAQAKVIDLWHRPGGFVHTHIKQADRWLKQDARLVIRDWQVSAAAIQVVYFKQRGGKVCYAASGFNADPALYFHLTSNGEHVDPWLGRKAAAKIGRLSAHSFKRFHPAQFGIGACKTSYKADERQVRRPKVMKFW